MPRLTLEVFQSRLDCTQELLGNLALLSDETLRDMNRAVVPAKMLTEYRRLVDTMRALARDAAKLAESASKIDPAENVVFQ
jgi:hypothetical protein